MCLAQAAVVGIEWKLKIGLVSYTYEYIFTVVL